MFILNPRSVQEKILIADQQLVATAAAKIVTGDVILTFAASSVVLEVLLQTHAVRTCSPHEASA